MCGIAGLITDDPSADPAIELDAMARAIRFRGIDGEGRWREGNAHLLHSRLAIVDLAGGVQPMIDRSGRYVITFGGEIHNFVELRAELEAAGTVFRTGSDTEVLLEGYVRWGPDVCRRLVGMFAFAVWDREERELFLARDHLGDKPLVWRWDGRWFWFASACTALAASPTWTGRFSEQGLAEYAAGGAPFGDRTLFEDVWAVPAGSWIVVRPGVGVVRRSTFWQLDFDVDRAWSPEDALDAFDELLTDAVRIRLRADVPSALLFSGGVDSGLIAAISARHLGVDLQCLTVDHDSRENPSREVARARAVAQQLVLPWEHEDYEYGSYPDDVAETVRWFDQPTARFESAQVLRMAQLTRRHATVALTGNGADELLMGYRGDLRWRRLDVVAGITRAIGAGRLVDPVRVFASRSRAAAASGFLPGSTLALEPSLHELVDGARRARATLPTALKSYVSLLWHATEVNHRVPDILSLANGVELRAVFLDHRVVDFATRLPSSLKVRSLRDVTSTKWLGKALYERYVGRETAYAPKLGMGANIRWDLSLARDGAWRDFVEDCFASLEAHGLDAAGGRAAWAVYRDDIANDRYPSTNTGVFRALMLGLWLTVHR